jgi:hypothetical protein
MLKTTIFASTMAVLLAASIAMPSDAEPNAKKKQQQQLLKQQKLQQKQQQQQELQAQQGAYDNSSGSNSGGGSNSGDSAGRSMSMFKAGNTTLPAGTYAMTNVSNGAAFVVIVDDSGDMRAQDARAMNLIDEKNAHKAAKNRKNGGYGGNSGNDQNYDSGNNYNNSINGYDGNDGGYRTNNSSGGSSSNLGPNGLLPPQPTPASAVLPTQNSSGHPLLQGATPGSVYAPGQPSGGGLLPSLLTGQNPLGQQNSMMPGQPGPGGIQGKIQSELQRQLNKQLLKYGSGNLEQQVRKMINKF